MDVELTLDQFPMPVLCVDRQRKIQKVNRAFEDFSGYKNKELIEQSIEDFIQSFTFTDNQNVAEGEVLPALDKYGQKYNETFNLVKCHAEQLKSVRIYSLASGNSELIFITELPEYLARYSCPINEDAHQVISELGESYWEWVLASDIVFYSEMLMDMLGYERKSFTGARGFWDQHIAKSYIEDIYKQIEVEVSSGRGRINASYPITTKDNRSLWVNVFGKIIFDDEGKPVKIIGSVRDISEIKGLIKELKKQNDYLTLAEKMSNSGHWRFDVKSKEYFWSTELYRIYGQDPSRFNPTFEEELKQHLNVDPKKALSDFQYCIDNACSYYNKVNIIKPSGEKVKLETLGEVEVDADGDVIAVFGVCRDITRPESLLEKLKLLAMVNYTIKVPIFFINEDDSIVYQDLSPQTGKDERLLFDYINFSMTEYMSIKKQAKINGQLKKTNVSFDSFNSVYDLSVTYEQEEGIYIWIVENVTEKYRIEQQQIISNRLALLGNTFGGVSHDINNVLGVALGSIELLELKSSQGEKDISKYIERVKSAIDKGKAVTERLLAFAKKPVMKVIEFDPVEDVKDHKYLFEQILINTIDIQFHLDCPKCTIKFPQGEFINILLNLVLNSQDAIQENKLSGVIEISMTVNETSRLEIHVKDSGCGIAEENLTKIFDPFYSSKSLNKGNGIGLANVYSTVYKHNGVIHVAGHSELGGAHFCVELPCKLENTHAVDRLDEGSALDLSGKHILILDDEASIAEFVALFVENCGAKAVYVNDKAMLEEALKTTQNFDIFITDMILPDLTGREAARIVKKKMPKVQVFAISGYIDVKDQKWSYPVLRKPFNSSELTTFLAQELKL